MGALGENEGADEDLLVADEPSPVRKEVSATPNAE